MVDLEPRVMGLKGVLTVGDTDDSVWGVWTVI